MKVNECEVGRSITVSVNIDGEYLEFKTNVAFVLEDSLLVEKITDEEGRTIGFKDIDTKAVYINNDDRPYLWDNVIVKLVKYNGDIYNQVILEGSGVPINRRTSYRQYVGIEGSVSALGINIRVMIKDVSIHGCAFVTSEVLELGSAVTVMFVENEIDYIMKCKIIRIVTQEDSNRFVYGCYTRVIPPKIEKYIMDRQRRDMQKKLNNK